MTHDIYARFDHADERYLTDLVRDTIKGEKRVKDQGEVYLPKPTGMSVQAYQGFRARAPFLAVPRFTLDLMLGRVFRKDTIFTLPNKMNGRLPFLFHGRYDYQWVARKAMREVLSVGRIGFLLDPDTSGPLDEVNIVVIESEAILEARKRDGKLIEAKLRLDDCDDDEHWRLFLDDAGVYALQKFDKDQAQSEVIVPSILGQTLNFIPLTVVNPTTFDPVCPVNPPLADIAQKAVYHYQLAAEYRQALHYVASPQPFVAGFTTDEMPSEIGPSKIWAARNPAAKAQFVTYSGTGLEEVRNALEMTKMELASMGAGMLLPRVKGVEAARTVELKDQEEASFVTEVAETVSDGLEHVLRMAATWERADGAEDVSVAVNKDVVAAKIDAQTLTALHRAVLSGHVSFDTWFFNLKRGEIVPTERTADDEREMIEIEGGLPDVTNTA